MSLFDELKPYRDADGLYHSKPVGPDGLPPTANGLLTTAIAVMIEDINTFDVLASGINAIARCELEPGLYRRSVRQTDQEAKDDYIGITACSMSIADEVKYYGEHHRYIYNNVIPDTVWKPWDGTPRKWYLKVLDFIARGFQARQLLGNNLVVNEGALLFRHIDFIPHLNFASMRPQDGPGWLSKVLWAISLMLEARAPITDQSARILAWLKIYRYKRGFHKSWLCDLAVVDFWKQMDNRNLTMKSIWSAYCNDGGAHPFSRYWEDMR